MSFSPARSATLHGGSCTGRGGTYASGIFNDGPGSILKAESVTALDESGSNNHGLYNNGSGSMSIVTQGVLDGATYSAYFHEGSITISNSRLDGSAMGATCVLVTRVSNISTDGSNCP